MSEPGNIVSFPDLKSIEEEAALWVARIDSRRLSSSERNELGRWLEQSPIHEEAMERMGSIWSAGDILDELNYMDNEQVEANSRWIAWSRFNRFTGAIAASVIAIGVAFIFQTNGYFIPTQDAHFSTSVGQQRTLELIDGSKIILNTNSEIEIRITSTVRTVSLLRGEAHFEVAPDSDRPFSVYAGSRVVKALGTAFTVFLREETVEVTVAEGIVQLLTPVDDQARSSMGNSSPPLPELKTIRALTVGQNAIFSEDIEHIEEMSPDALNRELSWRGGFISFVGERLSTVVADMSRYTSVEIAIEDPTLENTPIGGYFKVGDIDGMLEALESVFGVQVNRISPTKVTLTRPL